MHYDAALTNAQKCITRHHAVNASRHECITWRMHQHEADLLDAKECIRMQHVKNAAGYKMHQNATASHRKNAAAQNGSKMRQNVTNLQNAARPNAFKIQKNARTCTQMHKNAQEWEWGKTNHFGGKSPLNP